MSEINLYLMDMSLSGNTTGVDRYLESLVLGLKKYQTIHIYWINFLYDSSILFYNEEQLEYYIKVTIPLPQQLKEIINEHFWIHKYNEYVYHLIRHLFANKINKIIHIHTLNLIDLAVFIKHQSHCKIITHLHCIPWKELYNSNQRKFNILYKNAYIDKNKKVAVKEFITSNHEIQAYTISDYIICVTNCAKVFVEEITQKKDNKIIVIPNGIYKYKNIVISKNTQTIIELLYVGSVTESKGLFYILKALRKIQKQGFQVLLNIVGRYDQASYKKIITEYDDLSFNMLGNVSFEILKTYYQRSDIGVIASLQEQSSYVAIEMAMYGLPIVTTAVDGLDEMFTDNVNALKVNTKFSNVFGLSVDIQMLAEKIITLIQDKKKREGLGVNARKLYKETFSLNQMIYKTVSVYESVGGENYE